MIEDATSINVLKDLRHPGNRPRNRPGITAPRTPEKKQVDLLSSSADNTVSFLRPQGSMYQ